MSRIRILVPIVGQTVFPDYLADAKSGGLEISVAAVTRGPASIESLWEEAACVDGLATLGRVAESEGIDGVIVDCMGDPGVDVLRELLSVPVLGPAQTSMGVAAMLGRRFCVLTVLDRSGPLVDDQVRRFGQDSRYAGCEVIDIPVLDFDLDPDATFAQLSEAAERAILTRKADVLLLGCTGWTGLGPRLQRFLAERGHNAPVIDPMPLTIRVMAALIGEKLQHSKTAYPFPKSENGRSQ